MTVTCGTLSFLLVSVDQVFFIIFFPSGISSQFKLTVATIT